MKYKIYSMITIVKIQHVYTKKMGKKKDMDKNLEIMRKEIEISRRSQNFDIITYKIRIRFLQIM